MLGWLYDILPHPESEGKVSITLTQGPNCSKKGQERGSIILPLSVGFFAWVFFHVYFLPLLLKKSKGQESIFSNEKPLQSSIMEQW